MKNSFFLRDGGPGSLPTSSFPRLNPGEMPCRLLSSPILGFLQVGKYRMELPQWRWSQSQRGRDYSDSKKKLAHRWFRTVWAAFENKNNSKLARDSDLCEVVYTPKKYNINDHPWLDGLHLNSEIPGYYTRYLATIKDQLAILVLWRLINVIIQVTVPTLFGWHKISVIATKNTMSALEGPLDGAGSAEQLGNGLDSQGLAGDQILTEDPLNRKQRNLPIKFHWWS